MVFLLPSKKESAVIGSYHFVFEDEQCQIPEGKEDVFDSTAGRVFPPVSWLLNERLAAVICIEDPVREEAARCHSGSA